MGFLDHSTNNIIIDAVLTDQGRKRLANNDGSFQIHFFSLADDEVDYSIIEKFGRSVGKEKIIKNTPIFEAQTRGDLALKHRLLTLPNPSIVTLPKLSIDEGGGFSNNVLSFSNTNQTRKITVKQTINSNITMPDGTSDVTFSIFVPDRFLSLDGQYLQLEPTTRIATYNKVRTSSTDGAATVELSFTRRDITDTTYNIYGDGTTIKSVVSVVGDQSGLRKEFQVEISST